MPYALILAGIILTVAGVRNTYATLYSLLEGDFTGTNSFVWWTLSILAIGSVGYVPTMRPLANSFLALVLIVLVISNSKNGVGIFQEFTNAIKAPIPAAPVAKPAQASATSSTSPLSSALSAGMNVLGFLPGL